ncbi:hypothetical protein RJ641_015675 [Dillenia turbinata]|uniref:Uncharacterized protein n=1 Tax=Dillenia turbinata TaxID=194707 RepID=A0AAN8Z0B3_9MAGN
MRYAYTKSHCYESPPVNACCIGNSCGSWKKMTLKMIVGAVMRGSDDDDHRNSLERRFCLLPKALLQLTAFDVAQIYCLRKRLNAAILFKLKHQARLLPPLCRLPSDSVDSLTSMVDATEIDKSKSRKQAA